MIDSGQTAELPLEQSTSLISKDAAKIALAVARYALQTVGLYRSNFRAVPAGIVGGNYRFHAKGVPYLKELGESGVSKWAPLFARRGSTDSSSFVQVFVHEQYSLRRYRRFEDVLSTYRRLSSRGTPLILDIGANCGYATRYFRGCFPESHVCAVEPELDNFKILELNTSSEKSSVDNIQAGVASKNAWLKVTNPDAKKNAIQTGYASADDANSIRSISIDSILSDYASRSKGFLPFIAKIDIEGFESELFSGGLDWIDKFPIIFVELHDWMTPSRALSHNFLVAMAERNRDFILNGETVLSIKN